MTIAELNAKIVAKTDELKAHIDAHKDGMNADAYGVFEAREKELADLRIELKQAQHVERFATEAKEFEGREGVVNRLPAAVTKSSVEVITLGEAFTKSGAFCREGGSAYLPTFDVKTTFSTGAGWGAAPVRSDLVVMSPQRPTTLLDYLPSMTVAQGSSGFRFMLETTYTSAAAEIAEAGTYAESAFALAEQVVAIRKIGASISMTDEQLADVAGASEYLTGRLGLQVKQRLEAEVLAGNGTSPNILGLTNYTGVLTQARGAASQYEALYSAITKIRVGAFAEPNLVIIHPNDWQTLRMLQTSTGQFIWDSPSVGGPSTIFGLPVVVTAVATQGTAIVLCTDFVKVLYNAGLEFLATNSHGSDFLSGVQRIRASVRAGVMLDRAPALCTVTGL